jgi:hypothetical protein
MARTCPPDCSLMLATILLLDRTVVLQAAVASGFEKL